MLQRYHEIMQELHSVLPSHINKCDVRYPSENIMTYTLDSTMDSLEYIRDGVGDLELFGKERTDITHLVHAWHPQGHKVLEFFFLHHLAIDSCLLEQSYDPFQGFSG